MLAGCVVLAGCQSWPLGKSGWVSIFDGKSLDGWRLTEESPDTFRVEDGQIIVNGPRAHLFYDGPVGEHNFKNFEFKADVMTKPNSNSGMYIHTKWQPSGWPSAGYEIQVNNTYAKDPKKTASIYNQKNITEQLVNDNEWFTQHIKVEGKTITVYVNGTEVNQWTEPDDQNKLTGGTVALQGHDPGSEVHYKNIKVRILP
jgi:hypothetical protein